MKFIAINLMQCRKLSEVRELQGFPGGLDGKGSANSAEDLGSIPESGRFPGVENFHPLQYSCLENPRDRGTWQAVVHGVAKSQT